MGDRSHLSIGEVLSLLQDEFPDVTISKIRFLESQGLLDPERTPSGYRKFYDGDIERLRWILRQQKENFLPLKVIKDRLAAGELDEPGPAEGTLAFDEPPLPIDPADEPADEPAAPPVGDDGAAAKSTKSTKSTKRKAPNPLDAGETSVSMTLDELASATGLTPRNIGELERYGLLASRNLGTTDYYDEDALVVARLAAAFMRHGVEPRHLRMYKVAAERESGVFEQLVMPLVKQRNAGARRQALDDLRELCDLGDQMRGAMIRHALREYLTGG